MYTINKKIALLLILVLTLTLSGCIKKAPEGVGQEFYNDMVECVEKLPTFVQKSNTVDELVDNVLLSENMLTISEYLLDRDTLSSEEHEMAFMVYILYSEVSSNSLAERTAFTDVDINTLSELLKTEIKTEDLIMKK